MTPKAIANRIKAKGLQKLRWYCQMCQKQCRDENGFKCHTMSESHQRQLLLFAENPDTYVDSFSKEFEEGYVELLRRRFGTKRIQANNVYQEYITDRDHVHMNSTQWETLTDFVQHLGKQGLCTVDNTEKGWFVAYVDRDPETIRKMEAASAKEKLEMDDEEKMARFIQRQVERAGGDRKAAEFTDLKRESEEEKVTFAVPLSKKTVISKTDMLERLAASANVLGAHTNGDSKTGSSSKPSISGQKRKSALDEIMEFEEKKKEKQNRKPYWLHEGIVVKIVHKKLGEKYYKKKAVVKSVNDDPYSGVIKMIDSGDKLKIDQTHVETVLPATGKPVLIVNGAYRGQEARLTEINEKKFCCSIKLSGGSLAGRVIEGIQYEDVSKLHIPDR